MIAVAHKEALQALGADVASDVLDIASRPRGLQGVQAHVGPEDLNGGAGDALSQILNKTHGDGIHLLAACAARDPYPYGYVCVSLTQDTRENGLDQCLECVRIAEELGHADQQIPSECK